MKSFRVTSVTTPKNLQLYSCPEQKSVRQGVNSVVLVRVLWLWQLFEPGRHLTVQGTCLLIHVSEVFRAFYHFLMQLLQCSRPEPCSVPKSCFSEQLNEGKDLISGKLHLLLT